MFRNLLYTFIIINLFSCNTNDYSPKPRGFFRIILPEKVYVKAEIEGCPYKFEIPTYSKIMDDISRNAKPCWKNIDFPQFNAQLHLSYYPISKSSSLQDLTEDARAFVFKHTPKATAIDQQKITHSIPQTEGLIYHIKGNTASNFQFYITDAQKHYLRGALYFNEKPNLDSIQPVLEFLKTDIHHLISSIRWK